jgi:hypothetical protein
LRIQEILRKYREGWLILNQDKFNI